MENRVKNIIAEQLGVKQEELKPEANLIDDLGADSLDLIELAMALMEIVQNYEPSTKIFAQQEAVIGCVRDTELGCEKCRLRLMCKVRE